MGAAQSQGVYSVLDLQHPELRNFRGLTRDGTTLMSASLSCQKPQYYQWKNQVKQFEQNALMIKHILVPLKHKYQEGGVCSTTGELTIEYEFFPKLLSAEIRDRIREKNKFTQAELWYLLHVIVSARETLMGQGYQVGDLQPRNIFLNANQEVKVGCLLSWPGQISAYRKAVLEEGFGYLAPEDIVRLKLGAMDNKDNTEAEIYSLGLTLLSASTLQPMKDLYSAKENSLDQELFNSRLSLFQQDKDYSDIFRAVVTNLLQMDPDQRMNQVELTQFLSKHSDQLQSKQALMFDNVGRKLQQSINALMKKGGGVSGATSHYSAVGSLYSISKQNTLKQNDVREEPGIEGDRKPMRQSQPGSNNIINYQLKNQRPTVNNVVSPRSQNRIAFSSQPSSPPPETNQIQNRQSYNPVGEKTSPRNTPPMNRPPSGLPQDIKDLRQPVVMSGVGLPSITPNIVSARTSAPHINFNSTGGPPVVLQNYHKPQKAIPIDSGPPIQQRYRPFDSIGTQPIHNAPPRVQQHPRVEFPPKVEFPPRVQQHPRVEFPPRIEQHPQESSFQNLKGEQEESLKSVDNLLIETKRGGFVVEMSQVKRKDSRKTPSNSQLKRAQEQPIPNEKEINGRMGQLNQPREVESKVEENIAETAYFPKLQNHQQIVLQAANDIAAAPIINPPEEVSIQLRDSQKAPSEKLDDLIKTEEATNDLKTQQTLPQKSSAPVAFKPVESGYTSRVKVWGVQKGKLTIQQVGNPEKKIQVVLPQQTAKTFKKDPMEAVMCSTVPEDENISLKASQPEQKVVESLNDDNYILIEEPSRATQKSSDLSENNKQLFIYASKNTKGTFEECWQHLLKVFQEPQNFCHKINVEKVKPHNSEHGQFIKVGPAAMRVHQNVQQGKVWLQNLPSSRCEGDFLCGVVKESNKKHYIWFNSSLRYNGQHFPSKEVMDQALVVLKERISPSNK